MTVANTPSRRKDMRFDRRQRLIVSANMGCLVHLAKQAKRPVLHWIKLLAAGLEGGS